MIDETQSLPMREGLEKVTVQVGSAPGPGKFSKGAIFLD
jgi:hypothetical protein